MKIIKTNNDIFTILFSADEFGIIRSACAEPLYGFKCDIMALTGWSREKALSLEEAIHAQYMATKGGETTFAFSKAEILFLTRVIQETLRELEWEFQTRTGYYPAAAEQLLSQLEAVA